MGCVAAFFASLFGVLLLLLQWDLNGRLKSRTQRLAIKKKKEKREEEKKKKKKKGRKKKENHKNQPNVKSTRLAEIIFQKKRAWGWGQAGRRLSGCGKV